MGIFVTIGAEPLLLSIGILVTLFPAEPMSSNDILSAKEGKSSVLASNE